MLRVYTWEVSKSIVVYKKWGWAKSVKKKTVKRGDILPADHMKTLTHVIVLAAALAAGAFATHSFRRA